MENQKKSMTTEQYFALRCEIIRRRTFHEVMLFIFTVVGIALVAIGASLNDSTVNTTGVVMIIFPLFIFFFL